MSEEDPSEVEHEPAGNTASSVHTQLCIWVGELSVDPAAYDAAVEALFTTTLRLAERHLGTLSERAVAMQEAEDLAHEFLVWIKREGNTAIENVNGLMRELKRFAARLRDPAQHELWEILSEALHKLFRSSKARRLDAPGDRPNRNDAQWVTTELENASTTPADLARFTEEAAALPIYRLRGSKRWYPEGKPLPKIISPIEAEELVAKLLVAARGVIRFRDLAEEARRHVFIFATTSQADPGEGRAGPVTHPDALLRLVPEAATRTERIWNEVLAEQLSDLLCGYFIPKHFRKEKTKLESFGASSTAGDRVKKLQRILARHLAIQPGQDGDEIEPLFREFVELVFERLASKCPEKT